MNNIQNHTKQTTLDQQQISTRSRTKITMNEQRNDKKPYCSEYIMMDHIFNLITRELIRFGRSKLTWN